MPRFITDCCTQVSSEYCTIRPSTALSKRKSARRGRSAGIFTNTYTAIPAPDTACASMVASAAPPTPSGITTTNSRSRPMFSTADTARKMSGTAELPAARSTAAK